MVCVVGAPGSWQEGPCTPVLTALPQAAEGRTGASGRWHGRGSGTEPEEDTTETPRGHRHLNQQLQPVK